MLSSRVVDRRSFFHSMVGGVAIAAAVRTWPFRVYSFPGAPRLSSIEELQKINEQIRIRNMARAYPGLPLDWIRAFCRGETDDFPTDGLVEICRPKITDGSLLPLDSV